MLNLKISSQVLKEVLRLHTVWLNDIDKGQRADLRGFDLRGVDLSNTDLRGADLQNANLCRALCDAGVQKAKWLMGSKWHQSDIPWWLGHEDQQEIIIEETTHSI